MTHWHIGPNFHNFVQRVMDWIRMEITSNLLTHNDSCEEVRPMKSLDLYKLSPSKTTKLIFAWFTSTRDIYVLYLKNWIIRASMAEKAVSELKDTSQELLEKLGEEEK